MTASGESRYVLGSSESELERLQHQAAHLAPATELILQLAGVREGMHVLDLGTGAGDIALHVSEIVGASGSVVGIDQSADALATAEQRRLASGFDNVRFVQGDVSTWQADEDFDALVGRLLLIYLENPAETLRRHLAKVRHGGVVAMMEFDMSAARSEPETPTVATSAMWVRSAFARAGVDPSLGVRLEAVLQGASLDEPTVMGFQRYLPAASPDGPGLLAGIVATMLPLIERTGVATPAEIGIDTLGQRVAAELKAAEAVLILPTLVGGWATVTRG